MMTLNARGGRYLPMWALVICSAACNPTEPPFHNAYWDNHRPGLYVDATNGEPLFSSSDKYDSGTGWPSFTQPIEPERVVTSSDWSFGALRTEVRSRGSDSHLGHVFDDGPPPTGLRYCINSFALRFIPSDELDGHGYREYVALFAPAPASSRGAINVVLSDSAPSDDAPSDDAPSDSAPSDDAPSDSAPSDAGFDEDIVSDDAVDDAALVSEGADPSGAALRASAEHR